jgi:hypothetical protein
MIQASEDSEFIHETFLSIFSSKCVLLGECFDRESFDIGDSFDFVNGCEVAFSEFFNGFEELMEALLIDLFGEVEDPEFNSG